MSRPEPRPFTVSSWDIPEDVDPAWAAKRELALSLRALSTRLMGSEAEAATLAEAKRHADAARALLDAAGHTSFVDAFRDGRFFDEPGFFADRQPLIGGCSVLSPPLTLHDDGGEGRVRGELVYDARFEGAPGWVHGGFVAAVFDQVMGYVLIRLGIPTVTRWLRVDYKRPTPTERPLVCRAWEVTSESGNTEVAAQMLDGERVTAEGSAVFAHLDVARFRARVGEGR